MDIKNTVLNLIKKYNTRNPWELADYLGIIVQKHNLGKYSGYYIEYNEMPCICVNSCITDDINYSKIILTHEIGHAVLHRGTECMFFSGTFYSKAKTEQEANIFCAEYLIPDEFIFENPGMTKKQLSAAIGYTPRLFDFKFIQRGSSDEHKRYVW